jgi:hypothetical protein
MSLALHVRAQKIAVFDEKDPLDHE